MSTHVGRVGSCCNNYNYQAGMFLAPYLAQDVSTEVLMPQIKPYTGWASYKNVKSGQYNRQQCWTCGSMKGFPQEVGLYNLNIVNTPLPRPDYAAMAEADLRYQVYQERRMNNAPSVGNNYLTPSFGTVYPKRYVKGNWPDEQLIYTNVPK